MSAPELDPGRWFSAEAARADLGARTIRGGAIFAVSRTVRGLLELLATLALARLLTPADYGLVGLAATFLGFVTLFSELGLGTATEQREALTHDEVTRLFWINVAVGLGLATICAASGPAVSWFFGEPRLVPICAVLALGLALGGAAVQHQALLRRNLMQGQLAAIELGAVVFSALIALGFAAAGAGPWALVAQPVSSALVRLLLSWWACDWRPGSPRTKSEVGEHLKMGGHVTGFTVVNYFARNMDDILIGRFAGTEALGLYQQAYRLLMLPLRQLNAPIASVAKPALARLLNEPERYRRAFLRMLDKVLLLTMPLGALLLVHAGSILELLLGPQWRPAEDVFRWLGLLLFSQPLGNATGWLFISQGRTASMFRWGLVGSGLSVASFVAGLPWGPTGVAAAYAVSGVLVRTPLVLWWVGREGPVRGLDLARAAVVPGLGGAVTGVGLLALDARLEAMPMAARIAIALVVGPVLHLLVVGAFPSGRAALADWASFGLAMRHKS